MAEHSEQEDKLEPLVIFYDSEASDGNVYYGDVIEIAATCHPGVVVGSFERLINTKQRLGTFAIHESGITEDLLQDKPFIDEVIVEFLDWIDEMVVLAQKKNNASYFPVLCAHGGYQFDFLILFANLERKGIPHSKFSDSNIHFADSFLFCQQLQQDDNWCLHNTRLSIDGLFHNFFPRHTIKGRHRAMGDVKAMVKIFTQTPLKNVLHLMSVSTTLQRVKYFVSQSSDKEQQLILEEKMSSLDACSRNMCSKRLLKVGLTYDLLKTVFQKCSSYMDFWQTLKKIGIDRKVAKHFTSQFSAMGLENQGSLGFALNAAMQNGSLSNGSSQNSNGHSDRAINGNVVSGSGKPVKSGHSKTSNSNRETNSSRGKGVIGTVPAERATSSSRAFEERPSDYAVTSSADERTKAYAMLRSAKQHDNKKDASENSRVASDMEQRSCPGVEPTSSNSVSSENGNSRDLSICNGDENWDSEIESSVRRGHFVLQFSEVIPSSIVQEDVCSSSAVQHTDARETYSKRAPTHPDRNQEKRIVGKNKELVSHSERNDNVVRIGQGKRHEHSHTKKSKESSLGFDKSNRNTDKQDTSVLSVHANKSMKEITGTLDKSKAAAVSSENRKPGTTVSSAEKEETKQVNLNESAGNMPKVTDATNSKTFKSSIEEVAPKELDLKSAKTKRKASSKKKPCSVTFVTPVDVPPVDPSADVSTGDDVQMTTVYVGDVPILVPVKKDSSPCEDDLDQPAYENEAVEVTGNGNISTDETAMSRKEGDTLDKEGPRSSPTVAEGMSLSKESDDGHCVSRQIEDGQNQKMDDSEESKASVTDTIQPTSTMESLSSSPYETSDTGSNLDYNKNEPGTAPVNHCPASDISDTDDSRKQVSPTIEEVNYPTAPIIEENPSYDMENAGAIEQHSEYAYGESENQGDIPVEYSSEVDISPDMATHEQMNGYPEVPWASSDVVCPNPNMYPMPPPQYPFQMPYPTAMPSAYGFYPRLPHMMPMIPGPRPVPYPTMTFASQGMIPFGGFPPRIPMPVPMFQPAVYPPAHEGPSPNLDMSEPEAMPQTSRSSPEVLGIPSNRIQTSEHQNNQTPVISNVSFSTSSDDHSARSSPFPVDDSSGKTTPLTTPHRSPVDDISPGALSSSDKREQGYHGRKGYRKETRPARYHTDERSRRPNRSVPWKESNYRDKVNKKSLPEKASRADLGDRPDSKSREGDGTQDERKTKASDKPFKEDKHSSRHAKESSDLDKKSASSSPKRSSRPPQPEQLTPPRIEKSGHSTSKHSPKTSKSARSDLASPRSSPTKSKGEQLTPSITGEKDHPPKTLHRDTRNERSEQSGEERNASSDPTTSQQTAAASSKSNQGSSSSLNESHKSDGISKRGAKNVETQTSSRASNLRAPPRTHPSSDGDPHATTSKSSSDTSARASSISDKKNDKVISSEKEPKQRNHKDESTVTPSRNLNKESKHYPSKSRSSENVKWPQSALASQKYKDPPKPQRDLSSRTRRARESHSSGSEREKRVETNRRGVVSHLRNEDVKENSKGEKNTKDSIPASGKVTSKEPFSDSGGDMKAKSDDTTQKNSRENQKSINYRDVLLGNQDTKAHDNEKSSPRTNRILSSDRVKDASTGSMEPNIHPESPNTAPTKERKNPPLPESGTMKNPRGTPHQGDQEKTVGKERRNERQNTKKQPYKEIRGGSTTRGSGMSREPTPRNSTRNAPRNRHYDSNNNNNIQSRNTVSRANKS